MNDDNDILSYNHYLTVGDLRKVIDQLPDDTLVMYQRIEDVYFNEYGWSTVSLLWERDTITEWEVSTMTIDEQQHVEQIGNTLFFRRYSQYIPAFCAVVHSDKNIVVINAHY